MRVIILLVSFLFLLNIIGVSAAAAEAETHVTINSYEGTAEIKIGSLLADEGNTFNFKETDLLLSSIYIISILGSHKTTGAITAVAGIPIFCAGVWLFVWKNDKVTKMPAMAFCILLGTIIAELIL